MEDVDKAVADAADKVLEMLRDGRQSHKRRRVLATLLGALVCLRRASDYTDAIGERTTERPTEAWDELAAVGRRIASGDSSHFGEFEAQLHYNSGHLRLYAALDLSHGKTSNEGVRLVGRDFYLRHDNNNRHDPIPVAEMPGVVRRATEEVLARLRLDVD